MNKMNKMNKLVLFILLLFFVPIPTNPPHNLFNKFINFFIKLSHKRGIRKLNTKVCEENLLLFNKIMNENGIFYWLSEGTALGAIRENRILPWDDDVDVSFYYNYRDIFIKKALPLLRKNGFMISDVTNKGNFIVLIRKNEKVDIDIVQKGHKCTAPRTKNTGYNTSCDDLLPYLNIKPITFLNTTFLVPGIEYLQYLYGKDWNIPVKKK